MGLSVNNINSNAGYAYKNTLQNQAKIENKASETKVTTIDAREVISPELKQPGNKLYLIKHTPKDNLMPNIGELKSNWNYVHEQILAKNIVSAYSLEGEGLQDSIEKMRVGNGLSVEINIDGIEPKIPFGSIVVESVNELDYKNAIYIGEVK